MTATPVVDNPKEIESIIKLSGEKTPKILKGGGNKFILCTFFIHFISNI